MHEWYSLLRLFMGLRKVKDTPLGIETYRLLWKIDEVVDNFPKSKKFTHGAKMINLCLDMYEYCRIANDSFDDREMALRKFKTSFSTVEVLIKYAHDRRYISDKAMAELSLLQDSIAKQCSAWLRKTKDVQSHGG